MFDYEEKETIKNTKKILQRFKSHTTLSNLYKVLKNGLKFNFN